MTDETNLYETLYADADDQDCGLDMIEQMFQHRDFDDISKYFDINSYSIMTPFPPPTPQS